MALDFLLEIGVEEIPAGFLPEGRRNLERVGREAITFGEHVVFATPRRLVLSVKNLPAKSEDREEVLKGPPARAAYDASGNPTKAAEGFAKKAGVTVGELRRDGDYVVATVITRGRAIETILADAGPLILANLSWPKSMRWNDTSVRFVRPVRWIVALLGADVIPFTWGGVMAGRDSFLRDRIVTIPDALSYLNLLPFVDERTRVKTIGAGVKEAESKLGATAVLLDGDETLPYLADHVELPRVLIGEFDAALADAPRELLELTMWKHQKYIPLLKDGKLIPKFIVVANTGFGEGGEAFTANVLAGNRRVLSARLSDARYFWKEDLGRPLGDRVADLDKVTFHKKVGSMGERVARIVSKARDLAPLLGVTDSASVDEAARLAKADLTTKMVFEFPELQGVIGRRLAEAQQIKPEIAKAIEEHYWPIGNDPRVPTGLSAVIALAEKADTLRSIFSVGLAPTGSADPFGLRRAAIGIVRILLEAPKTISVEKVIDDPAVLAFVRARALHYLAEKEKINSAVLEAVASVGWTDLVDLRRRSRAAAVLPERADYGDLTTSFKRVMNILEGASATAVDESLLTDAAEKTLHARTIALDKSVAASLENGKVEEAIGQMAAIRPDVDKFFDDVLVNCDDLNVRANRKALLAKLGSIFLRVIDFSKL